MAKLLCLPLFLLIGAPLMAQDWPQFRGPGGLGLGSGTNLPTQWSDDKNLLWKAKLPGRGASSPILLGEKIYLTCWSGAVTKKSTAGLTRHLLCFDRTGKLLWKKDFTAPAKDYPHKGFTALHGYASATPVSDGKHVFVFFGAAGVFAFDLTGNQIWQASVGSKINEWGSGASPVLFQNLVIVNAAVESDEVVALDQATGKKVWAQKVKGGESWSTPLLVPVANKTELVVGEEKRILGLDPLTGELLWTCRGIDDYMCPSAVADQGVVYAIGGLTTGAIAVKAGGRGDVTDSHRLWAINKGSNVSSPVYHDGHLCWAHEAKGVVYCVDAKTGKIVYQQRLSPPAERIYASATLADGKIYYVSRTNGVYVLQAGPQFKLLVHNQFASDPGAFNASPAISDNRIYLRSDQALYCVGIPAGGLEPILGKKGQLLLEEKFDGDTLPKGWSSKSGKLRVADGALRASQTKGERLCLFSCVQPMQDAAIQIDFKLGSARGINVSCNAAPGESRKRGHLFSVMITPAMWNITKHQDRLDPNSKVSVLVAVPETFEQGKWYTLLVETKGDDVVAQVEGKKTLRAADKDFRVKKPGIEFRVSGPDGGEASFDNLQVWELR